MFTVKEVSDKMDISEHTLRFWANSGFFPFVQRDKNNIRLFSEDDLGWVKIVKCLRSVGTDNKSIKRYIDLCIEGDSTIKDRYDIIHSTRLKTQQQIEELNCQLELLNYKESYYEDLIKNKYDDVWNPMNKKYSVK